MKIGILITSIGNFGKTGFYNAQEIGLAKELALQIEKVSIYKLVSFDNEKQTEKIKGYSNITVHLIPARNSGINGMVDTRELDSSLNAMIHFSDTQYSVPKVYHWCVKNSIHYIPYIGVVESNSPIKVKQVITNFIFKRNIKVYRKCACCAKTPAVQNRLSSLGVKKVVLAPVGLDSSLLKSDYEKYSINELKHKYGYQNTDKILLFIGRLIDEKQPLRMIEIFSDIVNGDKCYKLLMIGTGRLKDAVVKKVNDLKLNENVQLFEKIPNKNVWELYRMADSYINLNQHEIFGMAILEAMYYGCKVIAWKAPGPDLVIENGISGWIINNNEQVIEKIRDSTIFCEAAHKRVFNGFMWKNTAKKFYSVIFNNEDDFAGETV